MDENLDKKTNKTNNLIYIYDKHKIKIYFLIALILSVTLSSIFFNIYQENKNNLVSEKYIEAGLYLAKDDKTKSKELFEEIIYEKNSFYSLLSLNTLIEKNLVTDTKKVLNYFEIIESINYSKEQKDLIIFKKGLYLIKNSKDKDGFQLLKNLIEKDSVLKPLAKEVLNK
tara:strand:- start:4975 stop:5484 length:510 start_codon:yes stop_codon:yes gene_type:complete